MKYNTLSRYLTKGDMTNENDESEKQALVNYAKVDMPDLQFTSSSSTYSVRTYLFKGIDPRAMVGYCNPKCGRIIDAVVNGSKTDITQEGSYVKFTIPKRESEKTKLYAGNALERFEAMKKDPGDIICYLGEKTNGEMATISLCKSDGDGTPHVLVAGMSGAGKTVCLNTMILSLLDQFGPEDIKLYLLDPKKTFAVYHGVRGVARTAYKPDEIMRAMEEVVKELQDRITLLSGDDITQYNLMNPNKKLSHIIVFFDEIDSATNESGGNTTAREICNNLDLIAEQGRSLGIHLVLASQRPTKVSISMKTKANLSARVILRLATTQDGSIAGVKNAAKLAFHGDAYLKNEDREDRIQIACMPMAEVKKAVEALKKD